MIKKVLMMLVLAVGFSAAAYAGPREDVVEMVNVMQAMCPQDAGDGMTIDNVLMDGDNVIIVMGMPIAPEMMSQMQAVIPMMKSEMLKGLKQGDKDMVDFMKNIKAMGGNLIISMNSTQGDCDPLVLMFTADEL